VTGDAQEATPDKLSAQRKLTVTGELFQLKEFGAGTCVAAIVGGVLSMLTGTETVVLFPARSMASPETV